MTFIYLQIVTIFWITFFDSRFEFFLLRSYFEYFIFLKSILDFGPGINFFGFFFMPGFLIQEKKRKYKMAPIVARRGKYIRSELSGRVSFLRSRIFATLSGAGFLRGAEASAPYFLHF